MKTKEVVLQVEGMDCPSCAITIERSLSQARGVSNPAVNFATGRASLEYNPNEIDMSEIIKAVEKAGYKVTLAHDGNEAVEKFINEPEKFNMILMDIQMPHLDGREATRIIRKKGFKEIPIIAMTAEAMKGDRERSLAAGMDDYIPKPIKRDTIYKMVKKWCIER